MDDPYANPRVQLQADYFGPGASYRLPVSIILDRHSVSISGEIPRQELLDDCVLSEPLGNLPRHLDLPDGGRITISDLASLRAWERSCRKPTIFHRVQSLENLKMGIIASLVILIAFVAGVYFYVIPFGAKVVALRIPDSVNLALTDQSMSTLKAILGGSDTKIAEDEQTKYREHFSSIAAFMGESEENTRLVFLGTSIPNAFALPDGTVCITDGLIALSEDEYDIVAVLAHELVHVRERHALRSVLQGSFVLLFWSMITGDIASLSSIGSALPVMLAESRYSRAFEFEADEGAALYLLAQGWGTKPMQRILERLDASGNPTTTDTVMETLSTHPLTRKRIERLKTLAAIE